MGGREAWDHDVVPCTAVHFIACRSAAVCSPQRAARTGLQLRPSLTLHRPLAAALVPSLLQVVAFAFGEEGTTATVINAHTGAVQHTLSSAGEAEDLLLVPQAAHDGTADQLVYALVPPGVGGTVRLLPDTPQAQAAFAEARPSLAFWRADEQAGSVSGFGFTGAWLGCMTWPCACLVNVCKQVTPACSAIPPFLTSCG